MRRAVFCLCLLMSFASIALSQKEKRSSSVEVDSGYVLVDGGKLFYEESGTGETIVLLHDGILHMALWDDQFPVLARKHRVIRYDRRGFGKSTAPQAPFSHVEDLNWLFTQLKIDKAIVFGVSGGGRLALDFTLKYPDKVTGLVLVGAVVGGYGYSTHMLTRGGRIGSLDEITQPEKFIEYFGWEDPYEIYPENTRAKRKFYELLKANRQNVTGALGYFSKPPERAAAQFLSEIKVPALILVGEFDIPDVHAHAGVIEAGIPNAKREIVPNSGHLIPLDHPNAFNASVLRFLDGMEFFNMLNSRGVDAAVTSFYQRRESEPNAIPFSESDMNLLGYQHLQQGKIREAVELFKLNTVAYPASSNVYDSLGEGYMKAGNKKLAIENYEKSLKLNPGNKNAEEMLKQLRK